jgi:hypothetical protein
MATFAYLMLSASGTPNMPGPFSTDKELVMCSQEKEILLSCRTIARFFLPHLFRLSFQLSF